MSKNKNPLRKYLRIVTAIVVPFFVIWLVVVGGYTLMNNDSQEQPPIDKSQTSLTEENPTEPETVSVVTTENELITVAVLGLDESEALTDVMMIGVFNTETHMIDTFSIPRDTYIQLSDDAASKLQAPKVLKLNGLHAYAKGAGVENPEQYTLSAIEEIIGVDIDHHIKISLDVFNEMVDAIGGVEIYVPELMEYHDPYQDLYIYIEPGTQVLDGKKAEDFVRYRATYTNGDLDRIEMQHYFMQAFMKSALEPEIVKQIPGIISALYSNLSTDVGIWDILAYTKYLDDISTNNLRSYTIPGEAMYIDDVSYFVYDSENVKTFVDEKLAIGAPEIVESKGLAIEVLNGGSTNGLATKFEDILSDDDYTVISVGNYEGSRIDQTRIYVKEEKYGQDLMSYFIDAKVVVDNTVIPDGIDIQIVIGSSEK
ncbi:LCP family protein [Vallitalea okinawensis]|uniref:LCP family protein n=1 Tax=Vallitalea okinawensis TaxID=2078660 RepID=UPI000CFAA33C|nr:LCP family protein [Vallitalea okinawensis]